MQALVRILFDTRRVFVLVLLLGIFTLAARNITDPDFWWHLRTGQYIVETRSVPHVDPFSFTRQGQPWIAHEWLSEVFLYALYRAAGWGGLIVVVAALTTVTFFFVYLRCRGQPYIAGVLVLWAAFASRPSWGVRPQTLSILLASILLWILEKAGRDRNALWWVVPLTLLWANLHAGYSLGLALIVLFLMGSWLDGLFGTQSGDAVGVQVKDLTIAFLLSLAVVAVNPQGVSLYTYPFTTLHSTAMQNHIAEWFSPNFHRPEFAPFFGMLLAVLLVPAFANQRVTPKNLLLLCVSAYAALQSIRFVPIFVLVATPILAGQLRAWFEARGWARRPPDPSPCSRPRLAFHGCLLLILALFTGLQVRQVIRCQPSVEASTFPAAAVSFLLQHHPPGPLFNHYNWGGYLIWRLYPSARVFIDGRADVYGDPFIEQFSATYNLTGDWQQPLERWHVSTVLVAPDAPLAVALPATHAWALFYRDSQSVILVRTTQPRLNPPGASSAADRPESAQPAVSPGFSPSPTGNTSTELFLPPRLQ